MAVSACIPYIFHIELFRVNIYNTIYTENINNGYVYPGELGDSFLQLDQLETTRIVENLWQRHHLPRLFGASYRAADPARVVIFVHRKVVEAAKIEFHLAYHNQYFRYRMLYREQPYLAFWKPGDFINPGNEQFPKGGYFIDHPADKQPYARLQMFEPGEVRWIR